MRNALAGAYYTIVSQYNRREAIAGNSVGGSFDDATIAKIG